MEKTQRVRRLFVGFFITIISCILLYKAICTEVIRPIDTVVIAIINSDLTLHIFLDSAWSLFIVAPIVIIALIIMFIFGFFLMDEEEIECK